MGLVIDCFQVSRLPLRSGLINGVLSASLFALPSTIPLFSVSSRMADCVPIGVATLEPVLRWMEENVQRQLRLEDIATQAMMSTRTLSRRFREQTSTTPLQWLNHSRVRKAQCLLETTDSVEWIASHVGFGSSTTLRDQFKHLVGLSPQAYRRAFQH